MRNFVIFFGVAAIILYGIFVFDPINRIVLFNSTGTLDEQSFLDLMVGSEIQESISTLERYRFERQQVEISDRCALHRVDSADSVLVFRDYSWRRGVVCLFVQDQTLIDVSWTFQPLAP